MLSLRVVFGLWVLPFSAVFPGTPLEQKVSLLPRNAPLDQWLLRVCVMPWMRYDVDHYRQIINHGYQLSEGTAGFHPLYPLLATLLTLIGINDTLSLLLISTFASVILCIVFTRYVAACHAKTLAQPACWLLLLIPPGFVLLAPYNESTFLVLAVGVLWATHRERWWLAGLLGGLATLTRQQGLALMVPLAWSVLMAVRERRTPFWSIGSLALIPFAYALFVAYRAIALNDLHALVSAQSPAVFLRTILVSSSVDQLIPGQRIAWPWEALIAEIQLIRIKLDYTLVIDLILGWAGVLVVLLGLRKMTRQEQLYSLVIVMLSLCYYNGDKSPYLSLPRHMLLAFPIYIVLAHWVGRSNRLRILIEVFFIGNLFLLGAFVRNGWIP